MESQLQPPHSHGDHRYEEDPHRTGVHSVVEGEGEHNHHGEKKSVLKKVKEKAKKIKHTITKHGHEHEHGHGHEHDYRHDQISEEEDDEDDETETDPGVNGASVHESTVITGTKLPKQTDINLENPTGHTLEKRQCIPNVETPNIGTGGHRSSGMYNPNMDTHIIGTGVHTSSLQNSNVDTPSIIGAGAHRPSGLHNANVDTPPIIGVVGAQRHSGLHNPPDADTPNVGAGVHRPPGLHNPDVNTSNIGTGVHRPGLHNPNVDTPNIGAGVQRPFGLHNPDADTPNTGAGVHRPSGVYNPNVVTPNIGAGVHKATGQHNPNVDTPIIGSGVHKPSGLHNPNVETPNIGVGVHKPSGASMAAESRSSAPSMAVSTAGRSLAATQDKGANVKIGPLVGLEEDPHSPNNSPQGIPPTNYQAKVADPTGKGSKEVDVSPLVRHLDNMHVQDESKLEPVPESTQPYTGTHDQFAPHGSPTADQFEPGSSPDRKTPDATPADTTAGKVSSAASMLANKAAAAKDMVASKLGYGDDQGHDSIRDSTPEETDKGVSEPGKTPITTPVDTTAGKVSAATSVLADKAAAAKNLVASKLGYGDQGHDSIRDSTPEETYKGASEPSKIYDTTTGKVSSAASVLADKAAAAKNRVASKLGYIDQAHPTPEETDRSGSDAGKIHDTMPADTTAGKASSAASMLADKAAAAKNMVTSKLGYSDQGHYPVKGAVPEEADEGVSVKEYLAKKLRPGDEDKALSSVITERLHKKEGTKEEAPIGKGSAMAETIDMKGGTKEEAPIRNARVITETIHKKEGTKEGPPMGRVTVSKEVAARLGSKHENKWEGEDAVAAGMESTGGGGGMVDRLKGAVGSWLGKSSGTETAKNFAEHSYVSDAGLSSSGEVCSNTQGKLHESGY